MFVVASTASAAPRFVSSFDGRDSPAGSIAPGRLAVDESTGNVWVIDTANDVVDEFDSTGRYLNQLTPAATTARTFSFGGFDGIAVDQTSGNVYISSENASFGKPLVAFDRTGRFLWEASDTWGSDTCGVGVDPSGNLFAADYAAGVQQLSPADGSTIGSPFAITSNSCGLAFDSAGNLYVQEWNNGDVLKFDAPGYTTSSTIDPGGPINGARPQIAVDRCADLIYAVHPETSSVEVFDSSGTDLGGFGSTELTGGNPAGVGINCGSRLAYVSDSGHSNVDIYDTTVVRHTLTVNKVGNGTVRSDDAVIDCGATCSGSEVEGNTPTLTATPDAGWRFSGWSGGGCSGTGTCRVTMSADETVTATFVQQHRITVSKSGSGTVTSSPSGINCGGTCTASFDDGTRVTLTARAATGFRFAGWSGGGCSGTATCDITVGSDTTVTATFIAQRTLTVSKTGAGSGGVSSSPAGIDCGGTCSSIFDQGARVTLTATPAPGSTFTGWSGGGCAGTGTCDVTLSSDATVTANFAIAQHTLSVTKAGTGSGGVSSSPAGIDCGATCSALFNEGTSVTLTATPASGSTFAGWSGGGCSGTGTCAVTVGADSAVTATFTAVTPPPPGRATLSLKGASGLYKSGKVPVKLSCTGDSGATCTGTLKLAMKVTVKHGKKRKTTTVVVGKASVSLTAGQTKTYRVKLSGAAKRLLAKGKSLKTTLTAPGLKHGFTIKAPPKHKKK